MVLKKDKNFGSALLITALLFFAGARPSTAINLSLQEALRLSEAHSFGVAGARYDSLAAAKDYGAAKAMRYPTLSLNAAAYYIDEVPTIDLPFASMTLGSHETYQTDIRLALPIFTGGRIANQIKAQRAITRSREANLEARRLENASSTRRAYLSLMGAGAMTFSAASSLDRIRLIWQDINNLYSSGLADSSSILEAELALQKAELGYKERLTAETNASLNLARLLGIHEDEITLTDSVPTPDISIYRTADSSAINRPELDVLKMRREAAHYQVGVSTAALSPSISGFGGYSVGKPNRDQFHDEWNDYWTAGVNLIWDFNLGGRSLKTVSSARYQVKSAKAAYDELRDLLNMQANIAMENLKLAYENYMTSVQQYSISDRQYRIGQERYEAGKISLNRLLELEAELTSMEQMNRAARVNYYIAENEYLYAIGSPRILGGF